MTTTVDCYFLTPEGAPLANATVEFQPVRSGYQQELDGILLPKLYEAVTDVNGQVTVELFPSPIAYTVYVATADAALSYRIIVPVSDLTWRLQDLIVEEEAAVDAAAVAALAALSLLARARTIQLAASDETTALAAGTSKIVFRMPYAMTNVSVRASLTTAQATGTVFTVDINEAGVSILSTKLTINNTQKTSTTASIPAVVSDASLADDAEISIDIDQIGDGTAKGLKITINGTIAA